MDDRWDVVVIGAGITGLSAAYELARRGRSVVVLERTGVAAEQSAGLVRIFRILHGDSRLCALAAEARDGWRRWQDELGVARLLGDEGLVSVGPLVAAQAEAMRAAGADVTEIGNREVITHVPHLVVDRSWGDAIVDPAAGVLRIRRIQAALASRLEIVADEVVAIENAAAGASVVLADGSSLRAAHVLVCAGTATGPLAEMAGVDIDLWWRRHVRLTYATLDRSPLQPSATLVLEAAYGLPVGTTGRWALGLDAVDDSLAAVHANWSAHDADAGADRQAHTAAVRAQHRAWLPVHMPTLDPEPVDEVRCVSLDAPWLDERGDGFVAARHGCVIACSGSNMMKFGPVLGDRLARTVLAVDVEGDGDDDVHADLLPRLRQI